jgi:hypothetical protein
VPGLEGARLTWKTIEAPVSPSVSVWSSIERLNSASVSLSLLLDGTGSLTPTGGSTVTEFTTSPAAPGSTVPSSVSVTFWFTARLRPVHSPVWLS